MGWEPVVMVIVLVSGIVKIVQAKHGIRTDKRGERVVAAPSDDGETARLRDDLARLKDRVAVLERIVTDGDRNRGLQLEREIEALRRPEPALRDGEARR